MPGHEFAPGIPARRTVDSLPTITAPRTWTFVVQRHDARRAGTHLDLRLSDGTKAHSWALRAWPRPGEMKLAVQQPTHTHAYLSFQGPIKAGYGMGQVTKVRDERVEILSADDGHVRFNLYPGQASEEYLLKRTSGANWLLRNLTKTRDTAPHVPDTKPKFRTARPEALDPKAPGEVWQAKVDGAHVLIDLTGSRPRVYSYRRGKKQDLIQHTFKIPDVFERNTPPELRGAILRGELTALKKGGVAAAAAAVGGLLNSGTWRSRQTQGPETGNLALFVHDVARWQGKDVENLDYGQKLPALEAAWRQPWLRRPPTAFAAGAKAALRARIAAGREKVTGEGLVVRRLDSPTPVKAKFVDETDVHVRRVFPETGKRQGLAGGFEYSLTTKGPVVGRVASGLDHDLKARMARNPEAYVGLRARVRSQVAPAGALRAPVFAGWHLDQQLPEETRP